MPRKTIGALAWILVLQYFVVEFIVQRIWVLIPYSMRINTISDLGATSCFRFPLLMFPVCSPLHTLMNASFVVSGLLTVAGSYLLRSAFPKGWTVNAAFWLLRVGALGVLIVGFVPEDTNPIIHVIGALILFFCSNAGLALLGLSLYHESGNRPYAGFTALCGLIGLTALLLIPLGLVFGIGLMERLVAYPLTVWEIVTGIVFLMKNSREYPPASPAARAL